MKQKIHLVACIVRSIAIVNFFAFIMALLYLGGDALNGKEEKGRYFLSQHGTLTEVSAAVFSYSKWHAISSMVLMAAAMILTLISKPSAAEQKWQPKLVTAFIVISFGYAVFKYR
jgi:hypothetical protein